MNDHICTVYRVHYCDGLDFQMHKGIRGGASAALALYSALAPGPSLLDATVTTDKAGAFFSAEASDSPAVENQSPFLCCPSSGKLERWA